ncbi:MAG: hypothetical protein KDI55_25780 [Anaerolineae bacterium]|nr:hypothetical protein [Anaerolineae bacterium]
MTANTFYHFDGDPEDERAWQLFIAAHSEGAVADQATAASSSARLKTLYELFLLFVIVVALAGTVFWQQSTTQIAAREGEIAQLQAQLATATALQTASATAAEITHAERKAPVLHIFETDHLRFVVEPGNVLIVTPILSQIDSSYDQLRQDLQLASITQVGKVTIYVTNNANGDSPFPYNALGVINIDMSVYTRQPTTATSDTTLDFPTDLVKRLARHALDEALCTRVIKAKWNVVIEHLYRHIVHGQEWDPTAALTPREIQSRHLAQIYPLTTVELTLEPGNWMYPDTTVASAVADALMEYILATYGRSSVPRLLDALSQYEDLEQVIPAVFAIPAEQFTTEWHTYLRLHYPMEAAGSTDVVDLEPNRSVTR